MHRSRLALLAVSLLFVGSRASAEGPAAPAPKEEPEVLVASGTELVELNLARFIRVDVGASYRWLAGLRMDGLASSDVSGFTFLTSVKFGKF